jgi:hypothetical protein
MCFDIRISNIIEWVIAIFLGIGGWFVATRSALAQQRQDRYNNLIQEFHQFVSDFQLNTLPVLMKQKEDKYTIQKINNHVKFIYWKARDLDLLALNKNERIYEKIRKAGEEFVDSTLLDPYIESALISYNKESLEYKNKFLQLANKFVENCYAISKFM